MTCPAIIARSHRHLAIVVGAFGLLTALFATEGKPVDLSPDTARSGAPARQRAPLFFMFAQYREASALNVIAGYFQSTDYIARRVAAAHPDLLSVNGIPNSHVFQIPTSLATVSSSAANLCEGGSAGLILYDIEHWDETPLSEQSEPGASINQCATIVANTGCGSNITYGIIPDGRFAGLPAGECTPNFSASIYDGLGGSGGTSQIVWSRVAFLGIQAQRLLDETYPRNCYSRNAPNSITLYVNFVSAISRYARNQNHNIICVAEVSFKSTSPPVIIAAIQAVAPYVDGIYLAYPTGGALCTPGNLKTVLAAFRPEVPGRPGRHPEPPVLPRPVRPR